jgi:hypothetical protein
MGLYRLKPVLRRQLSTAWDSAFNWVLNEPHEHHVALPLTVCLTIATLTLLCGWVRKASIILMCWTGLLRIGEALTAIRRLFLEDPPAKNKREVCEASGSKN